MLKYPFELQYFEASLYQVDIQLMKIHSHLVIKKTLPIIRQQMGMVFQDPDDPFG